jgi:hypothetical protein
MRGWKPRQAREVAARDLGRSDSLDDLVVAVVTRRVMVDPLQDVSDSLDSFRKQLTVAVVLA